jgi:hypothetical protein
MPWHTLPLSSSPTEATLFRACTEVHLGDDKTISFWNDRWVTRQASRTIAPTLYKLVWHKNISIQAAKSDEKWMNGLKRISSTEEVCQFVHMWSIVHQAQLSNQPDMISWCFTTSAKYSARSAYNVQFIGSISDYEWMNVWQTSVENKCNVFSWLVLQNKLWTTNHILIHGGHMSTVLHPPRNSPAHNG